MPYNNELNFIIYLRTDKTSQQEVLKFRQMRLFHPTDLSISRAGNKAMKIMSIRMETSVTMRLKKSVKKTG